MTDEKGRFKSKTSKDNNLYMINSSEYSLPDSKSEFTNIIEKRKSVMKIGLEKKEIPETKYVKFGSI